jgi:hypothetical protein
MDLQVQIPEFKLPVPSKKESKPSHILPRYNGTELKFPFQKEGMKQESDQNNT